MDKYNSENLIRLQLYMARSGGDHGELVNVSFQMVLLKLTEEQ